MCGIAGFVFSNDLKHTIEEAILAMIRPLCHRGPDDEGIWIVPGCGIALANRRLAVIDLSKSGHQPMQSRSGRFVITFNGEIYNYKSLRRELETLGVIFKSHTDTEVILESVSQWGLESALKRFDGMFALALWDNHERVLSLARDRLGEKPLYYGVFQETFLFGSELKSIRAFPELEFKIDRQALSYYVLHNFIPAPFSIYQKVYQLLPGTFLRLRLDDTTKLEVKSYWSMQSVVENGIKNRFTRVDAEAVEHLNVLLQDAVTSRMEADVPLGAFFSGGLDSSTIVALMQAKSDRPIKTFTIGFQEEKYNEAEYAREVARHLKTEHTELFVTSKEALEVIPHLPTIYDEPFADASQVPTYLVSKLTKGQVTVALSGDGGDEIFGGYRRYDVVSNVINKANLLPKRLRPTIAATMQQLSKSEIVSFLGTLISKKLSDRLYRLSRIVNTEDFVSAYGGFMTEFRRLDELMVEPELVSPLFGGQQGFPILNLLDLNEKMMYLDSTTYLPDDILVKVDRASMSQSLEVRAPFLDHRVVEFAWQLPSSLKIRHHESKWILRQLLYRYVPKVLVDRPKMGFGVPIDLWLCGPLKPWAEDLLSEKRLRREGFFKPEFIRKKWNEHQVGRANWYPLLWNILMFEAWLESCFHKR